MKNNATEYIIAGLDFLPHPFTVAVYQLHPYSNHVHNVCLLVCMCV